MWRWCCHLHYGCHLDYYVKRKGITRLCSLILLALMALPYVLPLFLFAEVLFNYGTFIKTGKVKCKLASSSNQKKKKTCIVPLAQPICHVSLGELQVQVNTIPNQRFIGMTKVPNLTNKPNVPTNWCRRHKSDIYILNPWIHLSPF